MSSARQASKRASSATTRSTAGVGFSFEDLFAADLLARFLLDQPIMAIDVPGDRLSSQTKALRWTIDDLLCTGRDAAGNDRQLAISCKSNLQVTVNGLPSEFVTAAWIQWRQGAPFNPETDRLALATRGRHPAFESLWHDIKTWCDGADPILARQRIQASAKHQRVFNSIRDAADQAGIDPCDDETIALIQRLEVFPTDFQLTPSSSLDQGIARARAALVSEDIEDARNLWKALVQRAEDARVGNGVIELVQLLHVLRDTYALKAHPSVGASWVRLDELTADYRAGIESKLPNGHVITLKAADLASVIDLHGACVVGGDSGVGKSAFVKRTLDHAYPDARQLWLGPETMTGVLSEAHRSQMGLAFPLLTLLGRSERPQNILVLDGVERLDAQTLAKAKHLLGELKDRITGGDRSWCVVLTTQVSGFESHLHAIGAERGWSQINIQPLESEEVRAALRSTTRLRWIADDDAILPLLSNARTLAWVIASASAFADTDPQPLTSPTRIADRLWDRWTAGRAALHRLLVRLAERDAAFERSFAVSDLNGSDTTAWDERPTDGPLTVNNRNRIVFRHDLASDWARYQRLKEIADDVPRWAALAREPLWIAALRLFGQFLLLEEDQPNRGWDGALAAVQEAGADDAADVLLDALCLDPSADRHLSGRAEILFADHGRLLNRLLNRFLHIATVPSIPDYLPADPALQLYFETEMRAPMFGRWLPMLAFLARHTDRLAALGSTTVARLCAMWVNATPPTLGEHATPFRGAMATLALETARTHQIESIAHRTFHGHGDAARTLFVAALAGALEQPEAVGSFALEMARRHPLSPTSQERVSALRHAERARFAAAREVQLLRLTPPQPVFIPTSRDLPPWPLGPAGPLHDGFTDAVLHGGALLGLMRTRPAISAQVLLACIVDADPTETLSISAKIEPELGIEHDPKSYPTIFWKSPFFTFFSLQPTEALAALQRLVDFATERWASGAPEGVELPSTLLSLANGREKRYYGNHHLFEWSQSNSSSSGQLFCALDALERWLVLRAKAGHDIRPLCSKLLETSSSVAILGVLVNVGKYQPTLFEDVLAPLLKIEKTYLWDDHRVATVGLKFDQFSWYRLGESVCESARDWVLAPHRKATLRAIAVDLVTEQPLVAEELAKAMSRWDLPEDDRSALKQRLLKAELDPANRIEVTDPTTGEKTARIAYPAELCDAIAAYERETELSLQAITLPYECRKAIAGGQILDDNSAAYLGELLPEGSTAERSEEERLMIVAAASTLAANGSAWLVSHEAIRSRVHQVLCTTIAATGATLSGIRDADRMVADQRLEFAAIGALHCAMADDPRSESWSSAIITVLSGQNRDAISVMMREAARHRKALGTAWWRLLQIAILAAGLEQMRPLRGADPATEQAWNRWLARLRALSLFGAEKSIADIAPKRVAEHVERLLERRASRAGQIRQSGRRSPPGFRFAGLSSHILAAAFTWLLDPEDTDHSLLEDEQRALLERLWAFEAARMQGDADADDGEYDLPSELGYAVLQRAPTLILSTSVDEARSIWQPIFALGSNGHVAINCFLDGWFLLLLKDHDADQFLCHWRAMLDYGAEANWKSGRGWYRGRQVLRNLLGLNAVRQLSLAPKIQALLPELEPFFRDWAKTQMPDDEWDIAAFCHFLAAEAGKPFRLQGTRWLSETISKNDRIARTSVGNALAEAMNVVLTDHVPELLAQPKVREALIDIVAVLVAAQIPTALALQRRIGALR